MTAMRMLSYRKHGLITFLLLVVITISTYSQKKIFIDNFNNNNNGWKEHKGAHSCVEIKNGALHLEKYKKNFTDRGCLWYNKIIPGFNTAENFSITFYAKYVSGGDIFDEIDFQWGETTNRSPQGNVQGGFYQLQLLFRGEVHLNYFDSKWTYFIRKDIKQILGGHFNPMVFNRYDIIQEDSFVIIKVNNREILRQLYTPITGNGIGIQQCLKSAWEMDKIVIRQDKKKQDVVAVPAIPSISDNEISHSFTPGLKVSPNPFDKRFRVEFYIDKEDDVQLSLIDMNGIIIQQHHKRFPAGNNNMEIYADVPAGAYVLKLQTGSKTFSTKLMKQ